MMTLRYLAAICLAIGLARPALAAEYSDRDREEVLGTTARHEGQLFTPDGTGLLVQPLVVAEWLLAAWRARELAPLDVGPAVRLFLGDASQDRLWDPFSELPSFVRSGCPAYVSTDLVPYRAPAQYASARPASGSIPNAIGTGGKWSTHTSLDAAATSVTTYQDAAGVMHVFPESAPGAPVPCSL